MRPRRAVHLAVLALIGGLLSPASSASASPPGGFGGLAFTADWTGDNEIYITDAMGTNPVNISNAPNSDEFMPIFTRSGDRLVFASDRDGGDFDLFAIDPDGTGLLQLTDNGAFDSEPTACGDDTIVFSSDRTGNSELFSINIDGTKTQRLTRAPGLDAQPSCNPQGNLVLFTSDRDGGFDLFELDRFGIFNPSGPINLTQTPNLLEADGEYSPFAGFRIGTSYVAYTSFDGENFDVFIREANGTEQQITSGAEGEDFRLPHFTSDAGSLLITQQTFNASGTLLGERVIQELLRLDAPQVQVPDQTGNEAQASVKVTCTIDDDDGQEFRQLAVEGTAGNDEIEVRLDPNDAAIVQVLVNGTVVSEINVLDAEFINVCGGGGDDTITAGEGLPNTSLEGGEGNDTLRGGNGLSGGPGNDNLEGGSGGDFLQGDEGNDTMSGGGGDDTLLGGKGDDTIGGGPGDDTLQTGGGNDNVVDLEGDNRIFLTGGSDTAETGPGRDTIEGGAGPDKIEAGPGADKVEGGGGDDTILDWIEEKLVISSVGGMTATAVDDDPDVLLGGAGNDLVGATGGNDKLRGGGGKDRLYGGGGDDNLNGDAGDDRVSGQGGNDVLRGGPGRDNCVSGPGRDQAAASGPDECERIS